MLQNYPLKPINKKKNQSSLMVRDIYELPAVPTEGEQEHAVANSDSDEASAKMCLAIFALRIRHEMSLADVLADRIASVFERTAIAPKGKSAEVLHSS